MAWTSASPSSTNSAGWRWFQAPGMPPQVLVFLQALLASKRHKGEQEVTALLQEAAELHFFYMQGLPLGPEYFEKLDPLFLACIVREYLFFCPKQVSRRRIFMAGAWSTGSDSGRGLPWPVPGLLRAQVYVCVWGGAQCFSNSHVQHADHPGVIPVQGLTQW